MSQNDMSLANASGAAFRADVNSAVQALVSNNSGATAPATTFAYMWWADTTAGILKQRNAANSAWIEVLTLSTGRPTGAAASGANSDITSLGALVTVPTVVTAAMTPPVRQTVLGGPVDTNGFAAFGGSTGSTTVTAAGTLTATAANGVAGDRTGSMTNPSWTGLSTNGTMFLYLDIAANGTCTTGSTTLAPTYRWGGADVTTNNQFTFNIQEMVGKVGNGATAAQTYRVFVGEVTVSGAVVTAITWYALMGRFISANTTPLPAVSTAVSFNSNLGTAYVLGSAAITAECLVAEFGYSIGDQIDVFATASSAVRPITPGHTRNTVYFSTNTGSAFWVHPKGGGEGVTLTAASWRYRMMINRGW